MPGSIDALTSAAVPIIGQAFTLLEVVPIVVLVCNCEAKKTLSLPGLNAQAQCPACKRVFSAQSVESAVLDQATGSRSHKAQIAMGIPR